MHNRKFDIQKDFHLLNEMENKILPICDSVENEETRKILKEYIRKIFFQQFKK